MKKQDLREQLRNYKFQFGLLQKIPCSVEENKEYTHLQKEGKPLPDGIFKYEYSNDTAQDDFYTVAAPDLTVQELDEYLTYKKLSLLRTIKNCVVFFAVLTIIYLVVVFINAIGAF